MALKTPKEGAWTYDLLQDAFVDPAVCIISYCLPCVQYGMNAEAVHGPPNACLNHGLKFWLYSCICACGLVAGPTRKGLRKAYKLPADPAGLGADTDASAVNTDCIAYTIPCIACFALCQEANEIKARASASPVDPRPFDWAPVMPAAAAPAPAATTTAPAPVEMTKEEAPAAPAAPAPAAAQ